MKLVKVIVVIAVIIVIVAIVFICGVFFYIHNQLGSGEFKQQVVNAAEKAIGSEVKITNLTASLFKGISLQDVSIANPPGFKGEFLSVDEFLIEYEFWPLLRKQVRIKEISIRAPVITLRQTIDGIWNYEVLLAAIQSKNTDALSRENDIGSFPLDIFISHFAVQEGIIQIIEPSENLLFEVRGFNFSTAVEVVGAKFHGNGKIDIQSINVTEVLLIEDIVSPITITQNEIRLDGLSCRLADGSITGTVLITLSNPSYAVELKIVGSKIDTLLAQANINQMMSGELHATAKIHGTRGTETIIGNGEAEIQSGQLLNIPLLNFIAEILQIHELQDIQFEECQVEFSIANNIIYTSVINLKSPNVILLGNGSITLSDLMLNHEMTLQLRTASLGHAPKEIRALFTTEHDDWAKLHFRVWGPHDAPKTDLKNRIVKGTAQKFLEKGLEKLLQ